MNIILVDSEEDKKRLLAESEALYEMTYLAPDDDPLKFPLLREIWGYPGNIYVKPEWVGNIDDH